MFVPICMTIFVVFIAFLLFLPYIIAFVVITLKYALLGLFVYVCYKGLLSIWK